MVRVEQLAKPVVSCCLFVITLCAVLGSWASGTPPGRQKAPRGHQWYWFYAPQEVAISPDGRWLAACLGGHLSEQPVGVWLLNLSGREARLINPGRGALCVAFSPDSRLLASCSFLYSGAWFAPIPTGYPVQLWDVWTGSEIPGLRHSGDVEWIALSEDGRTLAAAKAVSGLPLPPLVVPPYYDPRNLLHLWDRQRGEPVKLSTSYHGAIRGLSFSPDSTRLAVAHNKHISLLDVRERQEVYRFNCGGWSWWPHFSPDGKFIAAGSGRKTGRIHVWDVDAGKERPLEPARTMCPWSVVFSPVSDTLAAAAPDNTIHFWEIPAGRVIRSLTFPEGAPCPFFFTPDGKALIGGGPEANPVIHMWDVDTGKEIQRWDLTAILNGQSP